MNYKNKSNPTMGEILKQQGIEIDTDVFDKAKRNLEFKADYAELEALCAKFGSDAVITEIIKIQKREGRN